MYIILSDIFNFILGILILTFILLLAGVLLFLEFIVVVIYTLFDKIADVLTMTIMKRADFIVPILYRIEKIEKYLHTRLKKWF